ncbi:peptidylprolyl isomerase [Candidatus Pacearchaeota archaeon CG1_02_35_32]|nr:MAG: peptidylprolyl isomerase [Candidatus Pacearchaeota archaeon CG1_02_35_32]
MGVDKGQEVVLETNYGDIVLALYSDMPVTTGNFVDLVNEGYYDGVKFHRVINGFMIQGGDPYTKDDSKKNLWGAGGPGYTIEDEFNGKGNLRGTISMANAGANTGGSQFFINLVDNNFLDGKHPVFGEVISGMGVVDKIGKVQTTGSPLDRPLEDVVIERIYAR